MPQKVATPCLIFFRAGHARYAGSCTWETHRGRAVGRSMASSAHVAIARCAGSCTGETHRGRAVGRSMASSARVAWLARKKIRHHRPEVATFRDPWGHADWALALRMRFPAPVIGSKHGACFASGVGFGSLRRTPRRVLRAAQRLRVYTPRQPF